MAERRNRSRVERLKYGICLNEECEKCRSKEILQIPMRREFVCDSCGKELRECPPPKKKNVTRNVMIILAILLLLGLLAWIFVPSKGGEKPVVADSTEVAIDSNVALPVETVKSDTVINTSKDSAVHINGSKVTRTVVISRETTVTTNTERRQERSSGGTRSTLNLSYGKYVGETKGGYPNGMGRLTYNQHRTINRYDQKGRTADSGEYIIGEFVNGFFVQGKHYSADGNLIESLIIGVAPEDVYEAK